jgi:hypothetical protein
MYIGLGAVLVMGSNPLPTYLGYAISMNKIAMQDKEENN